LQADPPTPPVQSHSRSIRLWLIPLITLLALAGGFAYLASVTPVYTASARLRMSEGFTPSSQRSDLLPASTFLHMQIESIESAQVIASALEQLRFKSGADPVGEVKRNVHVDVTPGLDGLVISVSWPEAQPAAQLANALADVYLARASREHGGGSDQRVIAMQQERQKLLEEQQRGQKQLAEFQQANPEFAAADAPKAASERLASLTQALTAAQLDVTNAKAAYDATAAMLDDPQKATNLVELNRGRGGFGTAETEANQTRGDLAQVQDQLVKQKETMLPQNPVLLATQKKVDELKTQLAAQERRCVEVYRTALEQQWQTAAHKVEDLADLVREQNALVASISVKSSKYAELAAGLKSTQDELASIDERLKVSQLITAVRGASLRLEQPAVAPARPSWPVRTRVMSIALGIGLLLGCLAAIVRLV